MDIQQAFEIIGIDPSSSRADLKHAYRSLVKKCHPDRFQHDPQKKAHAEENLKQVNQAYRVLCRLFAVSRFHTPQAVFHPPQPPPSPRKPHSPAPPRPDKQEAPLRNVPFQDVLARVFAPPPQAERGTAAHGAVEKDSVPENGKFDKPFAGRRHSPWMRLRRTNPERNMEAISPIRPVQRVPRVKKIS